MNDENVHMNFYHQTFLLYRICRSVKQFFIKISFINHDFFIQRIIKYSVIEVRDIEKVGSDVRILNSR